MNEDTIKCFIKEIDRVLSPSGHLFLWVDKFHLCQGVLGWFENLDLKANVVFEVNVCVLFNFYHFFRPVMKHYIIICPLQRLVCILCIRNILAFLL